MLSPETVPKTTVGMMEPTFPNTCSRWQWLLVTAALLTVLLLTGCGQVVTRPTPTPVPTATVALPPTSTPKPTPTPAPYTPAPTPTPTITPTPIIYTIQRGDNLFTIARRYGVTVQALQDVNGIVDPRSLQIGQQLVIPMDEESLQGSSTATPTPTPMPYTVENLYFQRTPQEDLWCFGEVHNQSDAELEQVRIAVRLLDAKKQELASGDAFVLLDLIEPDGRAPFAIHFSPAPSSFASYEVIPLSGVPAYVGSYYRDLEVRDVSGEGERYAAYTVFGHILNVGPEEAVEVTVVVTLYDPLGRVVGVRKGTPEHNVIPRGGETTFRVTIAPIGGPVAGYQAHAQGRRLMPTPVVIP